MDDAADLTARLNWHAPEAERRAAIEWMVAHPERLDLAALILPSAGKAYWDGAAEVLTRVGHPWIDLHLPALMEWLKDLNWPGARAVFAFLKGLEQTTLLPPLRQSLDEARVRRDTDWEWSLAHLADARGDLRDDRGPSTRSAG